MNDWMPIRMIGITLPGAGVGVEIVNAALGSVGEPHPGVNITAARQTDAMRKNAAIRFAYHTLVRSAP